MALKKASILWLNGVLFAAVLAVIGYLITSQSPEQPRFHGLSDDALQPDTDHFSPKRKPRPGEWLAEFDEPGQTFRQYLQARPVRRTEQRNRIVLQPIGTFSPEQRRFLEKMRRFAAIFFDCPVEISDPVPLPQDATRSRRSGRKTWTQVHAGTILSETLASRLPANAICYLGITMTDLYPEESWNYVFGQANLRRRVGVYSLARYFPDFWGKPDTAAARRLALLRAFGVLSHETGHMFSIQHCIFFECLMNGSNSLEETDSEPGYLCPICLRKLQWNLSFDVRKRYQKLQKLYEHEGLNDLATWMKSRLKKIGPGNRTPRPQVPQGEAP